MKFSLKTKRTKKAIQQTKHRLTEIQISGDCFIEKVMKNNRVELFISE